MRPNLEKVPRSNGFFDTVKDHYQDYAAAGLFEPTDTDAMYIYQIKTIEGWKFTGLIACTDLAEYSVGNLKKHEKTILSNEERQANLLQKRGAAIKPILLSYPAIAALDELIADYIDRHRKYFVMELGGEKHRFWQITEGLILKRIRQIFADRMPHAYIADGHHRAASFAALNESAPNDKNDKLLCAYFPDHQLKINAFHRFMSDLTGMTYDAFLAQLATVCTLIPLSKASLPTRKFDLTMRLQDGRWFRLTWKIEILQDFGEGLVHLDVHLLNEKILKPILGVKNIRTDGRLTYIEGTKTLQAIEKIASTKLKSAQETANLVSRWHEDLDGVARTAGVTHTEGVCFCLFPVSFPDLKAIVDDAGIMPPKSTFIEPRMKNGLLVYEIF
ncbi:MAG: DUF1015 domain-containing protein [Saprospiraceae bacterium]|nr:DUF1015 domain-containing protein [Saprospiraceae bacterium]